MGKQKVIIKHKPNNSTVDYIELNNIKWYHRWCYILFGFFPRKKDGTVIMLEDLGFVVGDIIEIG